MYKVVLTFRRGATADHVFGCEWCGETVAEGCADEEMPPDDRTLDVHWFCVEITFLCLS